MRVLGTRDTVKSAAMVDMVGSSCDAIRESTSTPYRTFLVIFRVLYGTIARQREPGNLNLKALVQRTIVEKAFARTSEVLVD
jgi:hypothetical protein